MRALEIAKQIAWTIPITVAFTDLVASVIKVEGPSMQPTFNPQIDKPSDWVLVEKVRNVHNFAWAYEPLKISPPSLTVAESISVINSIHVTVYKQSSLQIQPWGCRSAHVSWSATPVHTTLLVRILQYDKHVVELIVMIVIRRAPDDPQLQITKRLIGLEHDVVWDDRNRTPEVIGQVRKLRSRFNSPALSDFTIMRALSALICPMLYNEGQVLD